MIGAGRETAARELSTPGTSPSDTSRRRRNSGTLPLYTGWNLRMEIALPGSSTGWVWFYPYCREPLREKRGGE